MIAEAIGTDTQAVLLLTAALGKRASGGEKPLMPSEYSALAEVMRKTNLRPADLLRAASVCTIEALVAEVPSGKRGRIAADRVIRLLERGGLLSLALTRWTNAGVWVLSRADSMYPSRYKRVLRNSAPPIVFGVGPQALLERGGVAVVGSRKPEPSSAKYAEAAGYWAAGVGMQVVSGAARGVDELAMVACAGAGGSSLGVVAESLLQQSTRRQFRDPILEGRLALISSFDPETPFNVGNAMARNRWIYALADRGLVVACSEERGGTWAGAIEALRHSFPVFARRGNLDRPGNEALIQRGAIPIEDDFSLLVCLQVSPFASETTLKLTDAVRSEDPNIPNASSLAEEIFSVVALLLLRMLHEPMTAKEVVDLTKLPKTLVDNWLKRLVVEQRVTKVKTRFQSSNMQDSINDQPSLFSGR